MKRREPARTVREAVKRALVGPVLCVMMLSGGYVATRAVLHGGDLHGTFEHEQSAPAPSPTPSQARLAAMMKAGKCWNDSGTHPIPSHSWFKRPGGTMHYGSADAGLHIAFDGAPGVVYAFCLGGK